MAVLSHVSNHWTGMWAGMWTGMVEWTMEWAMEWTMESLMYCRRHHFTLFYVLSLISRGNCTPGSRVATPVS